MLVVHDKNYEIGTPMIEKLIQRKNGQVNIWQHTYVAFREISI